MKKINEIEAERKNKPLETETKAEESVTTKGGEQGERPKFGPRPKFDSKAFDFKQELA